MNSSSAQTGSKETRAPIEKASTHVPAPPWKAPNLKHALSLDRARRWRQAAGVFASRASSSPPN